MAEPQRDDVDDEGKPLPERVKAIGARAKKARDMVGMSQAALAERLGLSKSHMSRFESGKKRLPIDVLLELVDVLGQPSGWLLNEDAPGPVARPLVRFEEQDRRRKPPSEKPQGK